MTYQDAGCTARVGHVDPGVTLKNAYRFLQSARKNAKKICSNVMQCNAMQCNVANTDLLRQEATPESECSRPVSPRQPSAQPYNPRRSRNAVDNRDSPAAAKCTPHVR